MTKNEAYKILDGAKKIVEQGGNPGPKTMNLVQEAMGVINKKKDEDGEEDKIMRWESGPMILEDYVSRILHCKERVDVLEKRLETCEEEQKEQLKERIKYYKRTIADDKKAIKHMFNSKAMTRSFSGPVSDEYYLALIDKEGCVKGVIL